ncbi:MAG: LemA family protein [Magnetococcales bacterium]|nr:LemA family protein [Magnetococcales bacterium]
MDELEDIGLEVTSSERMQRMRKLMRQLYQEEADHTVKIPPIRSRSLILAFSIGAVIILVATTFYNFNRFVTAEEQVLAAKGHIHDALQRRSNLFGNLVNLTLNHAMLEQEVFRYAADGRVGLMGQHPASAQSGAFPAEGDQSPAAAVSRLFGLVEQYPDIKTSTTYQQLMDKLVDIENMISLRRDEYNEQVRVYNTLITSFPWWVMAKVLGFERHAYFSAQPGPDNMNMELNANKFLRLIPEIEFGDAMYKGKLRHGREESPDQADDDGSGEGRTSTLPPAPPVADAPDQVDNGSGEVGTSTLPPAPPVADDVTGDLSPSAPVPPAPAWADPGTASGVEGPLLSDEVVKP